MSERYVMYIYTSDGNCVEKKYKAYHNAMQAAIKAWQNDSTTEVIIHDDMLHSATYHQRRNQERSPIVT